MTLYNQLLKEVETIILNIPMNIYSAEHEILLQANEFELVKKREVVLQDGQTYLSKRIGMVNIIIASNYVIKNCKEELRKLNPTTYKDEFDDRIKEVWENIMEDLEELKVIKRTPEFIRENMIGLVTDNTQGPYANVGKRD